MSVIAKFIARGVFDTETPGKPSNYTRSTNSFDDKNENSNNPFFED